jgi:LacI family transcriptional regulator
MSDIRRVTLADIARQAGVHVTTVSMALRDHPRIPETTRKRLREMAEKMGYAPDPILTALAAYRTRSKSPRFQSTIAYLTSWGSEWGWKKAIAHGEFYTGAEAAARNLGFQLDHFWMQSPDLTEVRLNRILRARGITGLILASHGRDVAQTLSLDWANFSCVKIDYFPHEPLVHNVSNDQSGIVRLAMRKVMEAGYRRIGFVMHRGWDDAVDHNWTGGYLCEQQQMEEENRTEDRIPAYIYPEFHPMERWLNWNNETIVPRAGDFRKWLRRYKPEVILSNGAFVGPLFKELKMRIPEDIAFVDIFLRDFSGITAGVRQNHETVGATAVEILCGQIKHNKRGLPEIPLSTFVEGTWFDGASCPVRLER